MRAPEHYYPSITLVLAEAGVLPDVHASNVTRGENSPLMRTVYPPILICHPSEEDSNRSNITSATSTIDREHVESFYTTFLDILSACRRVWKRLQDVARQQAIELSLVVP